MLDFYFWFRFSRLRHHSLVILHLPTKLRQNRTIRDSHDVIYIVQDGGHRNSTSGFVIRDFAHFGKLVVCP